MMRSIKFRAWDKPRNAMIQWFSGFFSDTSPVTGYGSEVDFNDPEMIIMQFTGLKDKNGTEIYEGDIIQHTGFAGHIKSGIEWNDSRMGWTDFHPREEFIVIGNIFENPELLEDK